MCHKGVRENSSADLKGHPADLLLQEDLYATTRASIESVYFILKGIYSITRRGGGVLRGGSEKLTHVQKNYLKKCWGDLHGHFPTIKYAWALRITLS